MKKQFYLLFFSLVGSISAAGQAPDSALAFVKYRFSHVRDTMHREMPHAETMVLFLGKTSSLYKSYDKKVQDAILLNQLQNRIANPSMGNRLTVKGGGNTATTQQIFQYPRLNKLVYKENLMSAKFVIEETMPVIQWKLSPESRTLGTLRCQKATGMFMGREYTAWFCPDLPYVAGPWKLNGLPGLIVEAYDRQREVVFLFDGIQPMVHLDSTAKAKANLDVPMDGFSSGLLKGLQMSGVEPDQDPSVIAVPSNAVRTTRREFQKLHAAMLSDPQAFMRNLMGGSVNGIPSGPETRQTSSGASSAGQTAPRSAPVMNNPLELPGQR